MSRTITIHRNDGTTFTQAVDKLRTPATGGGSITWVPEEDTRCEELRVTANGTYNAEARGKYGYDYVTVSVPGSSVTGKDPETGKETGVTRDPETGDLEKTVLPVEIRVIVRPYKVTYLDGEPIVYSGIVVKAYDSDGEELQTCPYNELVFPTRYADAGETDSRSWTNGSGINAMMIKYSETTSTTTWIKHYPGRVDVETVYVYTQAIGSYVGRPATYGSPIPVDGPMLVTRYDDRNFGVLLGDGTAKNDIFTLWNGEETDSGDAARDGWFLRGGSSGTMDNSGFKGLSWDDYLTSLPISTTDPTRIDISSLAGTQALPVQWARPVDGMVLETSFKVSVSPQTT